jgi:hypothetical protein
VEPGSVCFTVYDAKSGRDRTTVQTSEGAHELIELRKGLDQIQKRALELVRPMVQQLQQEFPRLDVYCLSCLGIVVREEYERQVRDWDQEEREEHERWGWEREEPTVQ